MKYRVKFTIDTDSHSTAHLSLMRYGVSTAKRAWLTPDRILNTLGVDKLLRQFKK
jgi:DNA polymerase (family 10)